jgi:hypothetical protein
MQISPPKSFNCPSDTFSGQNQDENPQVYWDFGIGDTLVEPNAPTDTGFRQDSYGYQVPYGTKGRPSSDRDQRVILAADRGPYSPVYEGGQTWPTGMKTDGIPNRKTSSGWTKLTQNDTADDWKVYNSPNHGGFATGEGQNILYAGGSAEWQNKPCCGIGYDMIYTRWSSQLGAVTDDRVTGTPPANSTAVALVAPYSDTDSMIYP